MAAVIICSNFGAPSPQIYILDVDALVYLTIHPLKDICVVSISWLLGIKLL